MSLSAKLKFFKPSFELEYNVNGHFKQIINTYNRVLNFNHENTLHGIHNLKAFLTDSFEHIRNKIKELK